MHAHSIAHLDLSLENICMGGDGNIRLIDFGVAAQHPFYTGDRGILTAGVRSRNASDHIRLMDEIPVYSDCLCGACRSNKEQLLANDIAVRTCIDSGHELNELKFLCRPMCERMSKPGKLGYMS